MEGCGGCCCYCVYYFIYYFLFHSPFYSRRQPSGAGPLLGCRPDNGSSFGTRGSPRSHWTRRVSRLLFSAPDWLRGFGQSAEGRPRCLREKKRKTQQQPKNPPAEVSINQRAAVRGDRRREGRVGVDGGREARSDRAHRNLPPSRCSRRSRHESTRPPRFDAALLVTVGFTLDSR